MKTLIFSDYGIKIFQEDTTFSILYDHGGIVPKFREDSISSEESAQAQVSEHDAYKVLLRVMKRNGI